MISVISVDDMVPHGLLWVVVWIVVGGFLWIIIVSWEVALLVVALRLVGLLVVALWVRVSEREAEVSLIWVGNTITVIIWVTIVRNAVTICIDRSVYLWVIVWVI